LFINDLIKVGFEVDDVPFVSDGKAKSVTKTFGVVGILKFLQESRQKRLEGAASWVGISSATSTAATWAARV
jgi:hypothetical protein